MAEGSMKMAKLTDDLMAKLTDDILADIISRVPYKSSCCCKCICTRWRDLISHPYHRKKMPQPLTGFFYESNDLSNWGSRFTNISGKGDPLVDPSLSFLPKFKMLSIEDCCNGLLLCSYGEEDSEKLDYVVCNPATEKWVAVPGTEWSREAVVRLAFDPAVSSHFHVYEFVDDQFWANRDYIDPKGCIAAVVIYSSKTGVWSLKADAWSDYEIATPYDSTSFLFRGVLYLCAFNHKLVAIDVEDYNWRVIPVPAPECHRDHPSYDVYLSQGQLHFAHRGDSELSIWVLEDPSSENWMLKHNVSHLQLLGTEDAAYATNYRVFYIHPDRSWIFLVCKYEETLMLYDMDSRELRILCQLGWDGQFHRCTNRYLPYVPLYWELLADVSGVPDGH